MLVAGVYYLVIIVKDSSIIKINFMGKIFYFEMNFLSLYVLVLQSDEYGLYFR